MAEAMIDVRAVGTPQVYVLDEHHNLLAKHSFIPGTLIVDFLAGEQDQIQHTIEVSGFQLSVPHLDGAATL